MGIISCLGLSRGEVAEALRAGRSGVRLLPERRELGFQSALSGVITGFDEKQFLDRKRRKTLSQYGLWAWAAVEQALVQADIDLETLVGDERTGLVFGNDSSAAPAAEQVEMLRAHGETRAIGSGHIFQMLNSTITLNLNTILKVRGVSWTVSSACASGAMAVGQGAELIASGRQERVICGGAQEISWQGMCSLDAIGALSRRESTPHAASRPFDRDRDGLVPSGGAAAVVLESMDSAQTRGVQVLGEIRGFHTTSDGGHVSIPTGEGLERAMRGALNDARTTPEEIDLVLAHATSTPAGDRVEAAALRRIFTQDGTSGQGPLVTAVKGLTGHEFWMAGASQVVYGLLMAHGGFVAGNVNLANPDPAAEPLRLPRQAVDHRCRTMLCNAAGFGGTNAALVIGVPS
jgi:3-oxoacyl-[acyl-carrier-protein] synthase-1